MTNNANINQAKLLACRGVRCVRMFLYMSVYERTVDLNVYMHDGPSTERRERVAADWLKYE